MPESQVWLLDPQVSEPSEFKLVHPRTDPRPCSVDSTLLQRVSNFGISHAAPLSRCFVQRALPRCTSVVPHHRGSLSCFLVATCRHHCRTCGIVVCQDCSERRHPTFPEVRICSRCYSKIIVSRCCRSCAGRTHLHRGSAAVLKHTFRVCGLTSNCQNNEGHTTRNSRVNATDRGVAVCARFFFWGGGGWWC